MYTAQTGVLLLFLRFVQRQSPYFPSAFVICGLEMRLKRIRTALRGKGRRTTLAFCCFFGPLKSRVQGNKESSEAPEARFPRVFVVSRVTVDGSSLAQRALNAQAMEWMLFCIFLGFSSLGTARSSHGQACASE